MEKDSWKKELYFVRYSISKFRDFSGIFLNFFVFFMDFYDFEHIHKNATLIFEVEIYKNVPPIFIVQIYRNAPPIFEVRNLLKYPYDFLS